MYNKSASGVLAYVDSLCLGSFFPCMRALFTNARGFFFSLFLYVTVLFTYHIISFNFTK